MSGVNWSKIGRKSRRKGKAYECVIARWLTEVTGWCWQSTRNSGRTDLKGDVYCVGEIGGGVPRFAGTPYDRVMVECKHRMSWSVAAMIKGNKTYTDGVDEIVAKYLVTGEQYDIMVIFVKSDLGQWVHVTLGNNDRQKIDGEIMLFVGGRWWTRLPDMDVERFCELIR